ncbi:unnamed protein product [Penicillium glandicola]
MSVNVDNAIQISKDTQNANPLSLVGHLQYAQKDAGSEPATHVYVAFTFIKAILKQGSTWACVKRIPMHLNQDECAKVVQKRANKKPAAQQYQGLSSDIRRAHINQLMDELKHNNPLVESSFVYVKEHTKLFKPPHVRQGDYETVSMDVIIMQRPMKTQAYSRTSMGGSVAVGKPLGPDTINPPLRSHHRDYPLIQAQNGNILQPVPQGLPSQLAPAMNHFARLNPTQGPAYEYPKGQVETAHPNVETSHPGSRDQLHEAAQSTAVINNRPATPVLSATNSSDMNFEDASDCSSPGSSDPDDAAMLSDQSDETSATDDAEDIETETECQEPQANQASLRQQNTNPYRRESSYGPHSRRKSQSRSLDRRHGRNYSLRDQFEVRARSGSAPAEDLITAKQVLDIGRNGRRRPFLKRGSLSVVNQ